MHRTETGISSVLAFCGVEDLRGAGPNPAAPRRTRRRNRRSMDICSAAFPRPLWRAPRLGGEQNRSDDAKARGHKDLSGLCFPITTCFFEV